MRLSEHFAQKAFEHQEKDKNWIYSPYSITVALGITYLGTAGKTREEMETALQFSEGRLPPLLPEPKQETILSANRMFVSDVARTKNEFSIEVEELFDSHPQMLWMKIPERAAAVINHWVSEETKEKITELIKPSDIDPDYTRIILINALYFSGQWKTPFEEERTADEVFYKNGTEETQVKMMTRTFKTHAHQLEDCKLVQLPYRDDASLFIILPNEKEGWKDISPEHWERNFDFIQSVGMKKTKISLPRFSVNAGYDISELLKRMGIVTAFSDTEADFTRITEEEPLKIDKVLHRANISIDENGSEASAATAVIIARPRGGRMRPELPFEVKVDHPFFFVLRHNETKEWLFVGQYLGA